MLKTPAPYPYVGSYALLETDDRESPRTELVRIVFRRFAHVVGEDGHAVAQALAVVAFPLRDGASGNREVPEDQLIDGTPLTSAEKRILADLDRELARRKVRNQRQQYLAGRRDRLKQRAVYAPLLERKLRELNTPWHQRSVAQRNAA